MTDSTSADDGDGDEQNDQPDLNNPMRFALHHRKIDVSNYLGDSRSVTEIEPRPAEGNIYVHWEVDNGE